MVNGNKTYMKKIKIQLSFSRKNEINRFQRKLENDGFPRVQMSLLVFITSGIAFLTSYTLLSKGLNSMPIRYFIVCLVAYGVFLLLLWLWLRTKAEDFIDLGDTGNLPQIDILPPNLDFNGGGGEFGGAGASGSIDDSPSIGFMGNDENPVIEAIGAAGEAEEFALPLIVLIIIVTVVLSSVFVIYSAPILFAELMVDSLLAAGLYRKLKGTQTQHWLSTAIKRTIWPFLITTVVSTISGYFLQLYEPTANSIGDILTIINATSK